MGGILLQAVTNGFLQAGGNRITEAPEVVFNLTLGNEGVETPLPNDSLKASQSSSRNSPLFFQERLANRKMFKKRV